MSIILNSHCFISIFSISITELLDTVDMICNNFTKDIS